MNANSSRLPTDGFDNFIKVLADETKAYKGQVVLVHGDTHVFQIDKVFLDQAHVIQNFTRVETFGSGNPHWVQATIDRWEIYAGARAERVEGGPQ